LDRAFNFLDYTRDGSVNIEETLAAFSKAKRAKIEVKMHHKGKMLLKKLYEVLQKFSLSLEDFFNSMDTTFQREIAFEDTDSEEEDVDIPLNIGIGIGVGGETEMEELETPTKKKKSSSSNSPPPRPKWMPKKIKSPQRDAQTGREPKPVGSLSTYELRSGFKRISAADPELKFSETDLVNLMRYIDPNGDGDISFDELEGAVERIFFESEDERKRGEIYEILRSIDDVAKANGMMLMGVFFKMDKDGSGEVDRSEFISGVMELKKPNFGKSTNYREPTFDDRGAAAAAIERRDEQSHAIQHTELVSLEMSGAGPVLRRIVAWTKERGLTISMLIKLLDSNGDGEVTSDELVGGIKKFMEPSSRVKASKKRKAIKEAKKLADDRDRGE